MDRPQQRPWLPPMPAQPVPESPLPTPAPPPRTGARRLFGPLFVVLALVLKFGKAALLLLPKAKVLTTSASMLVSVGAYALIWGWRFAVGFGAMALLLVLWPSPILVLILLLGGLETYRRWKDRKRGMEGNAAYYKVRPAHRALVGAVYVGLIIALAVGMDVTHLARTFSDA